MLIKDFLGMFILGTLITFLVYNLIYWNNLIWRYPDKFREITIANAKKRPEWFPFKRYSLERLEHQSISPVRVIALFVDTISAIILLVIIYTITVSIIK